MLPLCVFVFFYRVVFNVDSFTPPVCEIALCAVKLTRTGGRGRGDQETPAHLENWYVNGLTTSERSEVVVLSQARLCPLLSPRAHPAPNVRPIFSLRAKSAPNLRPMRPFCA